MAFKHSLVRAAGDFDLFSTSASEWDLGKILAVGESIPAYRYSASELPSDPVIQLSLGTWASIVDDMLYGSHQHLMLSYHLLL